MHIDGSTRIVGVLGAPVRHTASPAMHNAAFAALQMNWVYLAFHVEPDHLRTALLGARDLGLAGINLTLPHKILALEIVDEVDAEAKRLGAVNTIRFVDGRLHGFNTDGYGLARALQEEFNLTLKDKQVLVIGAGGAGRGIAVKCALDGAARVVVANRTVAKIKPIEQELARLKVPCESLALSARALEKAIATADLVVNATAVGLRKDDSPLPVAPAFFRPSVVVYDTIYQPPQTQFLEIAAAGGAMVANGLGMLLHQGARAFELWTEQKAPVAVMRRALRAVVYGEKP